MKTVIGFISCCTLSVFVACNNPTVDPYGESQFYFANLSSHRVMAKAVPNSSSDSILVNEIDIPSGDTGYFGKAGGMGSPSPWNVFLEIDLKITDTGDTISIPDTIKPIEPLNWESSQIQSSPQKLKWLYKYQ